MASLRKRTNNTWEIQYRDEYRRRISITLSGIKYSERTARKFQEVVNILMNKRINNDPTIHRPTLAWIEGASPEIRAKLARVGLCRLPSTHTTGELWDTYIDKHSDILEETLKTYIYAKDRFFSFFKTTDLLEELTQERMREWRQNLHDEKGYATATVAGTISKAKAVFNWAKSRDWIATSPLDGVGRGSYRNEDNDREITMEEYHRLLDAATCQEWRVIIALARIGGLRAPSEIMKVQWSKINWKESRFTVLGSKKGKDGKKRERTIPLFPYLRRELEALYERDREKNLEFVINRYPSREKTNLGTQFERIAKRAGIGEIDRPFDNMRASRANEIYSKFGAKVEEEWIGHSIKTAAKYYLGVHECHFEEALRENTTRTVSNN